MLTTVTVRISSAFAHICHSGMIHYKGATIQLLDMPGIIEGAAVCSAHPVSSFLCDWALE
jgi:ribosome-interacting GTPase 1